MNTEQLNTARLARWSQDGEARLTLEQAAEWLDSIGFSPYLPLGAGGTAPAPSFVEAVVGRPARVPSAGERGRANDLLVRMVENDAVVPLKMGASLGEQPDFLASPDALRYIYALRGDKNFKTGPSTAGNDKVTPLAQHCWQAIEQQGQLDVAALQPILGRDITEAAIARALQELWIGLYIFPVLGAGCQPAKWELLSRRFATQVAAGAGTGQAEAQSAMVSLYLYAVVAAPEEDVLRFLSPLAPQSKLREVMRGLGSMRQLDMIDIAGHAHVCLQGGLLPEMVAQLSEEQLGAQAETAEADTAGKFDGGIEIERAPETDSFAPKKFVPKKFVPREKSSTGAPARPRTFAASASGARPAKGRDFKRAGFERPPSNRRGDDRPDSSRPSFESRKPSTRGPGERARRWEKSGEGAQAGAGEKRPFERTPFRSAGPRPGGFKSAGSGPPKPWASKGAGARSAGAKPWQRRTTSAPPRERDAEERPRRWEQREDRPSAGVPRDRKPFTPKSDSFRASGSKPAGFKPRASASGGPGKPRPWASKGPRSEGAGAKPWVSRGAVSRVGSAKSYQARNADDKGPRKTFGKPGGAKPWAKRASSEGEAGDRPKRQETPDSTADRPAANRGAKPFWAKNPRGGKGSVAAGRSNRPLGGKKAGGKKGGKKK